MPLVHHLEPLAADLSLYPEVKGEVVGCEIQALVASPSFLITHSGDIQLVGERCRLKCRGSE